LYNPQESIQMALKDKCYRIPKKRIQLPSCGINYDNDVFAAGVRDGEVELAPFTLYDQILLRSPDMLLTGKGIYEVIKNRCSDIIKPEKLYPKDIDYIITVLFLISNGDVYKVGYKHTCENAKDHEYSVFLADKINTVVKLDPLSVDFRLPLPILEQEVIFNDISFEDLVALTQDATELQNTIRLIKSDAEIDTFIHNQAKMEVELSCLYIKGVQDGDDFVTDRDEIKAWLQVLPIECTKLIQDKITEMDGIWGLDFDHTEKCKDCGEVINLRSNINPINFFMQP
jgi:hypothetical protein